MRIIAGRYKRRVLRAPPGRLTRPTADRTREALFGMVESRMDLAEADVLDLFAGSGTLGLEALSRGARSATFVDSDSLVLKYARQNADGLGVAQVCRFVQADALLYLSRYAAGAFRLILADPPYDLDRLTELPDLALAQVELDGLFVLEHDARHTFETDGRLNVSRRHGQTVVSIFQPAPEA